LARWIIILSGPISSGKSDLARLLAQKHEMQLVKTKQLIANSLGENDPGRLELQEEGDKLDRRTGGRWVVDELTKLVLVAPEDAAFIVDSVRIVKQVEAIRKAFPAVTHVHLTALPSVLEERYSKRIAGTNGSPSYEDARKNPTERNVENLAAIADIVIDTDRCTTEDVFIRATARMSFFNSQQGYVDVLVGGQYGSEGKGKLVNYMSREYDLIVRVGGPNAGHTVPEGDGSHTYHILPSGSKTSNAELVLGPGMVVDTTLLLREIAECEIGVSRLSIDPHVVILTEQDRIDEQKLVQSIGSTGQGVGAATSRRIMQRGIPEGVRLAKNVRDLEPFIRKTSDVLSDALSNNKRILVEGTQGAGLSLYHGEYPYVTSRDTTVAGCLSEAGIAPRWIRKVIMVCRSYPIRVTNPTEGGTSGHFSKEVSWEQISQRSGKTLDDLIKHEIGSTTGRPRLVGEFDWKLLKEAAFLNGPTDIALTFADYLRIDNENAFRFEQLQTQTIRLIEEIERVAGAPVSLISTGKGPRQIIDRRGWQVRH